MFKCLLTTVINIFYIETIVIINNISYIISIVYRYIKLFFFYLI